VTKSKRKPAPLIVPGFKFAPGYFEQFLGMTNIQSNLAFNGVSGRVDLLAGAIASSRRCSRGRAMRFRSLRPTLALPPYALFKCIVRFITERHVAPRADE
jgi:hypothetical protein